MQISFYLILFNLTLLIYLNFYVYEINSLFNICVIFNFINFAFIFLQSKQKTKLNNIPKIINILFNVSVILFNYPDLIVSDTRIYNYGETLFIAKAFKFITIYQFTISIFLKFLENNKIGNVYLNKINFYDFSLVKSILQINFLSFILYLIRGNSISNLFAGRSSGIYGSFFKIVPFSGGFNTTFIVLNYFIQFNAVIGSLFILNSLLNLILRNKIDLSNIKISKFYKYIISLLSIIYLLSAFYSDVRGYIFIVLLPLLVLFFAKGKYKSNLEFKYTIQTLNTLKIIFICIVLFLTVIGSEIQVYRRGNININFFDRRKTEYGKTQGLIQTDKSLYNLSEIIKLTPENGTENGKFRFKSIPYQFIPSLLLPNKPTRINRNILQDVDNSIFNNFNFKFYNVSLHFTYIGEFILAFGLYKGYILAIVSTMIIFCIVVFILQNIINSIYYPYILVSLMSLMFYIARSPFQYLQELSAFLYSLIILWLYLLIKNKLLKFK